MRSSATWGALAFAGALITVVSPLTAQGVNPRPVIAGAVVTEAPDRPARQTFANGVTGHPGIAYAQPVGFRPLTLDLYLPQASMKRPPDGLPLVVFIHGGAWMMGDARRSGAFVDFPGVLASLAARGYAVASLSYRLSGEARFPAQAIDVRQAIRWLRVRSKTYGMDPERAVVWGASAGGHLAALAATACKNPAFDVPAPAGARPSIASGSSVSPCVQGAVVWFGVFNLASLVEQSRASKDAVSHSAPDAPEWRLLGCAPATCTAQAVKLASPASHIDPSDPPMLLIHGEADRTVPIAQSREMAARLGTAGVRHQLTVLPGIDHSFLGPTHAATRDATLRALDATFDFIDRTIGARSARP